MKGQQEIIYQKQRGSGQPHVYLNDLNNIKVPFFPIEKQQKIVEELEEYERMTERLRKLIKNFEKKILNQLNSLWEKDEEGLTDEVKNIVLN